MIVPLAPRAPPRPAQDRPQQPPRSGRKAQAAFPPSPDRPLPRPRRERRHICRLPSEALFRRERGPRNKLADSLGIFPRCRFGLVIWPDVALAPPPQAFSRRKDVVILVFRLLAG